MEAHRRSSLRSKRKPLIDCTNIILNRDTNPSKTLIKPPKKPSNSNNLSFPISSPPKSHTSTGSNNSPTSFNQVPSKSRSLDHSAPSILISHGGSTTCRNSRGTVDQVQRHKATRKEKGKMVAETPISVELSASFTTETLQISSSASPGHSSHSGAQAVENPGTHVQIMKDKEKITENPPVIESPTPFTSKYLQMSSSSGCSFSENSPVRSQNLDDERRKAKGKMVMETPNFEVSENPPVIQSPAPFTSKYIHMSSSDGSFSENSHVQNQKVDEDRRKAKGKMVMETPYIELSEPTTPHAPVVSFAASGTLDRSLTDYLQRRPQRGRKHGADNINFLLTSTPYQRAKKTGVEFKSGRSVNKSGSHTDPLPFRKKKRTRDKYEMHSMPKEEVEKLKTYFEDVDAFELPVEEVESENELE